MSVPGPRRGAPAERDDFNHTVVHAQMGAGYSSGAYMRLLQARGSLAAVP